MVNDYAYARRLRTGALGGYLDEMGVTHVITNRRGQGQDRAVGMGGLTIEPSDLELVYRVPLESDTFTQYALYRRVRPGAGAPPN